MRKFFKMFGDRVVKRVSQQGTDILITYAGPRGVPGERQLVSQHEYRQQTRDVLLPSTEEHRYDSSDEQRPVLQL